MDNNDPSELATLLALGLLPEPEHDFAAQTNSELAEAVQAYKAAFAALAYNAPVVPLPVGLKQRLFATLDPALSPAPAATLEHLLKLPISVEQLTRLRWKPYQIPGIQIARLHIDKQKREVAYLMRAEAGISLPVHRHAEVEEILILEGDLRIDQNLYGQGDYIYSLPGSFHSPHTVGGCLAFVRTSLDDEWLA